MDEEIKDVQTPPTDCECEGETCSHKEAVPEEGGLMETLTAHRGGDGEIALAFLLALTPLVVLTFFGQVGLI